MASDDLRLLDHVFRVSGEEFAAILAGPNLLRTCDGREAPTGGGHRRRRRGAAVIEVAAERDRGAFVTGGVITGELHSFDRA